MDNVLSLRIILEKPPAGVDFALQSGSGNNYESVQKQISSENDMLFSFEIKFKKCADAQYDFAGPFVQGNKGERFIYVGIGTYAGIAGSKWGRRLKIPLRDIGPGAIEIVIVDDKLVLEARVPGTGRDGGPNCATVKPFAGWHIANR